MEPSTSYKPLSQQNRNPQTELEQKDSCMVSQSHVHYAIRLVMIHDIFITKVTNDFWQILSLHDILPRHVEYKNMDNTVQIKAENN